MNDSLLRACMLSVTSGQVRSGQVSSVQLTSGVQVVLNAQGLDMGLDGCFLPIVFGGTSTLGRLLAALLLRRRAAYSSSSRNDSSSNRAALFLVRLGMVVVVRKPTVATTR